MKENTRTTKRRLRGVVVSDRMSKTRIVAVARLKQDSKYRRHYKTTERFQAHDEANEYHVGDKVTIEECRPLSRKKRWRILMKLES